MQNNCNNWFHLPPHFGYIQPASAPPQPFIQQPISRTPIETQQVEECSNSKGDRITKTREKWSAKQTELVVKLWVENFEVIESSRCNQFWPRIADKISTQGSSKTIKQGKVKVRNLKNSYKKCKDENKNTGNERSSCPYFHEFDR